MTEKEKFSIKWFDVTDSTNSRIAEDRYSLPDRSVYAALFQTAGRGQRGNIWQSAKGKNLTFSLLLKPLDYPIARHFAISEAVTLGITDYLLDKGIRASIKWPNDIYAGDRKICGILIENYLSSAILADCIIGIGLNLNQRRFDSSASNPTSVSLLRYPDGQEDTLDPREELPALLEYISTRCDMIFTEPERIAKDYHDKLYRRGEWHEYLDCRNDDSVSLIPTTEAAGGTKIYGCIEGVTEEGLLKMKLPEGKTAVFAFKELRYII